ncbi:hypothetical protein EVAR_18412_1 [Eumeta japonica]|uniref:Uncharacterized protein n=1 Tax=Eumeta variegata TaxID=151549 RepID=A0A4C1UVB8_EUMVA|nr:hypothetical protein EVAR_18412_1 [Eumeta japonica]
MIHFSSRFITNVPPIRDETGKARSKVVADEENKAAVTESSIMEIIIEKEKTQKVLGTTRASIKKCQTSWAITGGPTVVCDHQQVACLSSREAAPRRLVQFMVATRRPSFPSGCWLHERCGLPDTMQ